jgi:NADPH:quinone reductase-like Zn-dependent oxidoreductase
MARSLGADQVIDYTNEDFTQSGRQYDLILAVNGYHSLAAYKRALTPRGICVTVGGSPAQMFQGLLLGAWMSEKGGKQLRSFTAKANQKDLLILKALLEAGTVVPVIEQCYPLHETREALRYLGAGHARGKIVITVAQGDQPQGART